MRYFETFTLNGDLGCYTANLPAAVTCPGKTTWCDRHCYACKGQFLFPSVQESQDKRWLATQDLEAWIETTVREVQTMDSPRRKLSRRRDGKLIVRVHSAGDMYSLDYLRAWFEVAARCPGVVFYTYTRTWTLPEFRQAFDEAPDNFVIWCSVDPSHKTRPDWPRVAYVEGTDGAPKPNCGKQLCKGKVNCTTCNRCHSGRAGAVTFKLH